MKGLKTHESEKFNRYFTLIQEEAAKQGKIFFADAGDGNDFETPAMEGEIMMGWLISKEKAQEFEPLWLTDTVDDSWAENYVWAIWSRTDNNITVRFEE